MKKNEQTKIFLFSAIGLMTAVMLITDSGGVSGAVISCIDVCLNSLIPSLFGYMVLCTLLTQSGAGNIICMPLWYVFRKIIRLDSKLFSVFVMSQIGGYPVGAKLISALSSQSKEYSDKAQTCVSFCYNSGPAFITGIVGLSVYHSIEAGMIIFVSCLLANIIIGAVLTRKYTYSKKFEYTRTDLSFDTVKSSLISAGHALLTVCLSMILFNTVIELIRYIGVDFGKDTIGTIIMSAWEITNIQSASALLPLPIAAALMSFGGLCVIFQVLTLSSFKLSVIRFIAARLSAAAISGALCYGIVCLTGFTPSIQTYAPYIPAVTEGSPIAALCVGAMTVMLLTLCRQKKEWGK